MEKCPKCKGRNLRDVTRTQFGETRYKCMDCECIWERFTGKILNQEVNKMACGMYFICEKYPDCSCCQHNGK